MKFKRFGGGTLGLLAVGSIAWGCSNKADDCNANESCGPYANGAGTNSGGAGGSAGAAGKSGANGQSGTSGSSGDAGAAGASSGCDGSANPDSEGCVIGDGYALFVSTAGDDATADGTQARPYATLTNTFAATGPNEINRVYVCAGEYETKDTLTIPDRVEIYGGFSCDDGNWVYANSKALISSLSPIGASIASATHSVKIQDLRIDAANAPDGNGASSFGMTITDSENVSLTRVEINAGKGGTGKVGTDGAVPIDGVPGAGVGVAASCDAGAPVSQDGGKSVTQVCGSQGGDGGKGLTTQVSATRDGLGGLPELSMNFGSASAIAGAQGGSGQPGQPGEDGLPGKVAEAQGEFSALGYVGANGGNGTAGMPGQGGGGGGSSLGKAGCVGASGGAGGMGGCGGTPGAGGQGGGASVALLSWNSALTVDGCTLRAGTGGAGGRGGNAKSGGVGAPGAQGGLGYSGGGNTIGKGGTGGDGGNGGIGGSGSGGTGGPSIALVYGVVEPVRTGSMFLLPTKAAAAGDGGSIDTSQTKLGHDGNPGALMDVYEQPAP